MRAKHTVDGLALAGALVALVGVVIAANSALAEELQVVDSTAVSIHKAGEKTVSGAAAATSTAVSEAVETLERKNRLDLDIRLLDPTFTLIAGGR